MNNNITPFSSSFGDAEDLLATADVIDLNKPYKKGGFVVYSDTQKLYVITNDTHAGCNGGTGSKKTRSELLPSIYAIAGGNEKESMVVHDTKGTAPELTYDYLVSQGYDVYILNFCEPDKSDHYNPLDPITYLLKNNNSKLAYQKLGDIGKQVVFPGLENNYDKYWQTTTAKYHDALYKCVAFLANYDKRVVNYSNIIELNNLLASSTQARNELFAVLATKGANDIIQGLNSIWKNGSEALKNLLSMINNPFMTINNVAEILYKSDFTVEDLINKPTCVFIITPDESTEFNFIVSLLLKSIYGELIGIARRRKNTTLPRTINFLVDEFGALPEILDFQAIISASRSRNIRWLLIYQSYSQLCQIYGENGAKTIISNLGTLLCFQNNDYEFEDILRRLVGKRFLPYSNREVEVIPYGTLRTLKKGEAIILSQGVKNVVKVYFPDVTEHSFLCRHSNCLNKKRKNSIHILNWSD
ncbi:MAG: type IV secretory system conjugative DNA transfer family protein, partial [Clostridiales bacterium]|nr:type IV secretory system conjugative DNA transfer family protein [Clostridiales bacterium]